MPTESEPQPESGREEAKRWRRSEDNASAVRYPPSKVPEFQLNLITFSSLASWADASVKKLGRARTETILDIAEMMELLPGDLKQVLTKLINAETNSDGSSVHTRDYFNSLVQITALLGKDNITEESLLSMLSEEDGHR
jgi:hypothetical protein